MPRPSDAERSRVIAENKDTFRRAGVPIKGSGPLTKEEVRKLNAALREVRAEAASRMKTKK